MTKSENIVLLLFLLLMLFPAHASAQYVVNGGTPARIGWMQVEGDNYKVVYPQGADSLAKRYLWLLEGNRKSVMQGLGDINPAKLPVVLYNRTANSNGMVVWAPKRMELYTLPAGNTSPQKWDEQLALHESRHVGQMAHFTKGVYKCLSWLLGEQAPSIGVGIYPSRWMLEGDAVVAETELSNAGRGRSAEFMEYYRAAFMEGDMRNWDRWRLGSYRRYTPNIYAAGYLINSTIRYRTGKYAYAGEIFEGLVKNFYNPSVIGKVYNKVAGMKPAGYFGEGQRMMLGIWQDEMGRRGRITEPQQVLGRRSRGYQEYLSPVSVGKDSVLYIKYSYNNPKRLVLVTGGKEHVLRSFSASAERFRLHGNTIWFTENVPSSRWSNEVYSKLYSCNWKNGNGGGNGGMKELSGKGWYASPSLSAGGDTVLVAEHFPEGGSAVVMMDSGNGKGIARIGAPSGGELVECAFVGDDIYALAVTDKGLGLFRWGSGVWETVVDEQNASIENLQAARVPARMFGENMSGDVDVLYFVSDADGVRNIYMLEPVGGIWKRLTNARYGATEPHVADGFLYYSSLELGGRFPVKVALDDIGASGSSFEPYLADGKLCGVYRYEVAEELSAQARRALAEADATGTVIPEKEFAAGVVPRRYSKLGHLFRFHSWAPVYYNVDRIMEFDFDKLYQVAGLGAAAYSQNTLGSAVTMLGYSWRRGFHAGHVKFKYTGWFPAFQISADINADEHSRVKVVRDSSVRSVVEQAPGPLVQLAGQVYLPLRFNSHGWQRGLTPQVRFDYDNNGYFDSARNGYIHSGSVTSALQFYVMRDIAGSAIFPKWGLGGVAKLGVAVNGGENFGNVSSLHLYGYLPGFASTHGLKLSASVQKQNAEGKNYWMGNMVGMPRGYKENFYCTNYFMAAADYAFPVYLGDVGLWELAYLKRLQVIPFADYAVGKSLAASGRMVQDARIYSVGTDLLVDLSPFKFGVECSVGVRWAYNGNNAGLPGAGNAFQMLFSVALP